jgi:hypothetical protein
VAPAQRGEGTWGEEVLPQAQQDLVVRNSSLLGKEEVLGMLRSGTHFEGFPLISLSLLGGRK